MGNYDYLNHARHNKDACDYIYTDGNFPDWVVTTAFYSCLHFIKNKLFPLRYTNDFGKTKTYNNFEHAVRDLKHHDQTKHEFLAELTEEILEETSDKYRQLMDLCMKARYRNYKITEDEVVFARNVLKEVADECEC
jgi:hypothetical protein